MRRSPYRMRRPTGQRLGRPVQRERMTPSLPAIRVRTKSVRRWPTGAARYMVRYTSSFVGPSVGADEVQGKSVCVKARPLRMKDGMKPLHTSH